MFHARLTLILILALSSPLVALDSNSRAEALRHLAIVKKEAGILTRLAATSPDAAARAASAELLRAAEVLERAVQAGKEGQALEGPYQKLEEAADAIEPSLVAFPPKGGAKSRLSNVRWSVARAAKMLELEDEQQQKFSVGPVSPEQAQVLLERIAGLLDRSVELSAGLSRAGADVMYRDLLRSQMSALIDPAATLKVTAKDTRPWWTPDAYKAVTQIVRLTALTKNETRKLPPPLLEQLKAVWTASEELEAAANDIEHGARASGSDAEIEYLPAPNAR